MTGPMLLQQKLPLPITPRGGAVGTVVSLEATGRSRHRDRDHRGCRRLRRTGYRDRGYGHYIVSG